MHQPDDHPARILLATDLSARCDRALDRALQLAQQWQVPLLVVHAVAAPASAMWDETDDLPSVPLAAVDVAGIERQIRRDAGEAAVDLNVQVLEGEPSAVISEVARREHCDLIVLGAARESLGRSLLGGTVEHLARTAPTSVLIVKQRPRGVYRHVLVGTDFTIESRDGLRAGATWFPQAEVTLLHALDIPYQSMWLEPARRQEFADMELATIGAFLDAAGLPADLRRRVEPVIEHGQPERMLRRHVLDNAVDLTVVGALRRGLAFHVFIGGSTPRIVYAVPSDVLVVRAAEVPAAE